MTSWLKDKDVVVAELEEFWGLQEKASRDDKFVHGHRMHTALGYMHTTINGVLRIFPPGPFENLILSTLAFGGGVLDFLFKLGGLDKESLKEYAKNVKVARWELNKLRKKIRALRESPDPKALITYDSVGNLQAAYTGKKGSFDGALQAEAEHNTKNTPCPFGKNPGKVKGQATECALSAEAAMASADVLLNNILAGAPVDAKTLLDLNNILGAVTASRGVLERTSALIKDDNSYSRSVRTAFSVAGPKMTDWLGKFRQAVTEIHKVTTPPGGGPATLAAAPAIAKVRRLHAELKTLGDEQQLPLRAIADTFASEMTNTP